MENKYSHMQDWEINRLVLSRLGWTVKQEGESFYLVDDKGVSRWRESIADCSTVDKFWYWHFGTISNPVEDLEFAWKLPLSGNENNRMVLNRHDNLGFHAADIAQYEEHWDTFQWGKSRNDKVIAVYSAKHPTNPARALCEAWLLWHDSQKAEE